MGTIVTPSYLVSAYKGAVVPVAYRSDTVDSKCGSLSGICTVVFNLNGVDLSGNIPVSQTGAATQTQSAFNIAMQLVSVQWLS